MPVSALELRPRGAVALFDAAIRLTSRNAGLWALTLPGGALVAGALLQLVDAVEHHRSVLVPSLLFTAAWFARGVGQGAACWYVDRSLLGSVDPSIGASYRQALRRLPSLLITVAYLSLFNVLTLTVTLGLGFFFLSAHITGYAVAMQGKEHPLALYQTCSKMLGPARRTATGLRILYVAQVLLMLNIHVAANVLIYLGRKLVGLELTFAQRFTSFDNPVWLATVVALGFALFEPLRAAAASLLLVDGRVRQEGLDLLAAVDQLPARRANKSLPGRDVAAAVLFLLATALCPTATSAAEPTAEPAAKLGAKRAAGAVLSGAELRQRFSAVTRRCGMSGTVVNRQLDAVSEIAPTEHSSLTRLLEDAESFAFDDSNCDAARARLRQALPLIVQARDQLGKREIEPGTAAGQARAILARPEFAVDPEREKPPDEKVDEQPGWFQRFLEWLRKILDQPETRRTTVSIPAGGALSANLLAVVLVAGVVIALVYLLISTRGKAVAGGDAVQVTTTTESQLSSDPRSALSRPPEGWAGLADELAARGEFREALRSLYLALLSKLHRLGAIDYDPANSNWDYFRGFKGRGEWLPTFRELTHRFDFAYYGHLPVDADGYRIFRSLTQPLLTVDDKAEVAGA